MNRKHLDHHFSRSLISAKLTVAAVLIVWGILYIGLFTSSFFFPSERPDMISGTYTPVVTLEPASGGREPVLPYEVKAGRPAAGFRST